MPDGRPQVTPVWCDLEGDLVVFNSAKGRQKDRNVRRDPRVALAIVDPDNPYRYLEIRGRVIEITEEGADDHIDKMAKKYLGVDKYPYGDTGDLQDPAGTYDDDGLTITACYLRERDALGTAGGTPALRKPEPYANCTDRNYCARSRPGARSVPFTVSDSCGTAGGLPRWTGRHSGSAARNRRHQRLSEELERQYLRRIRHQPAHQRNARGCTFCHGGLLRQRSG